MSCFDAVKNISGVFADTFAKSCLQELEDQLHEEENKVSGLNKAKAKLERDLDEVRIFFYIERTILIGSLYFVFSIINLSVLSKSKFTKKKRKFEERLKNKREKWKATLRYDFFCDFMIDFDVEDSL